MNLKEFFNYSISNTESTKTTHLINIAAAISRFPGLMNRVISSFNNEEEEILKKYNEIKNEENELREKLTCAIIYGELYEKELFMEIIEDYVTDAAFNSIIYQNVRESGDSQGYALACALLDDYYTYLDTGIWNGLSTNIN